MVSFSALRLKLELLMIIACFIDELSELHGLSYLNIERQLAKVAHWCFPLFHVVQG